MWLAPDHERAPVFTVEQRDHVRDRVLALAEQLQALRLADLRHRAATYRVFLLPDALQLDVSMAPAAAFRPGGPRFRLLFGATAAGEPDVPAGPGLLSVPVAAIAGDVFGWGVVYALHARACIERGRLWQAEHYVGAVRDHGLALACLSHGLPAVQARGYDDLPVEARARFDATHVGSTEAQPLRSALAASVRALLQEGADAGLPDVDVIGARLAELRRP